MGGLLVTVQPFTNSHVGSSTSRLITWTALANGDTGKPLDYPDYGGDCTVSFEGTFGVGGSVKFEGSND